MMGFEHARALRPTSWPAIDEDDRTTLIAVTGMTALINIAKGQPA